MDIPGEAGYTTVPASRPSKIAALRELIDAAQALAAARGHSIGRTVRDDSYTYAAECGLCGFWLLVTVKTEMDDQDPLTGRMVRERCPVGAN